MITNDTLKTLNDELVDIVQALVALHEQNIENTRYWIVEAREAIAKAKAINPSNENHD